MKESVLVIGSGGREHALARSLRLSSNVGKIYCAPGNAGMADCADVIDLKFSDMELVLKFLEEKNVKLTVIGPEGPLVDGLSDALRNKGHLVVGASQKAAQLEGSKLFAKNFMTTYGIPTADFKTFDNAEEAKKFARSPEGQRFKILKADGLAAGKGVFVNETTEDVLQSITTVMEEKKFGSAGATIILEETLLGPELSVIALTDGKTLLPFPASQDHKRAFDNDEGPNTGGMGAYAPIPFYDDHTRMIVNRDVISNFLRGLQSEKLDFRGFIYFGLMLTKEGPKVLEFNVRFGDPEAQTVLPLIESDLYATFRAVAEGNLANVALHVKPAYACTVVLASGGYPGDYESGFPIQGLDNVQKEGQVYVFHAGTKNQGKDIVTSGGRVLNVTGVGKTLDTAVVRAYQGIKKIIFKDAFFRKDIAGQALKNKNISNRIKRMKQRNAKETTLLQS